MYETHISRREGIVPIGAVREIEELILPPTVLVSLRTPWSIFYCGSNASQAILGGRYRSLDQLTSNTTRKQSKVLMNIQLIIA